VTAEECVWEASLSGLGTLEGAAAIRSFLEDWIGLYEEFEIETEEILDSGGTLSVSLQQGRPVGGTGYVQLRVVGVAVWAERMVERFTTYGGIDEARAAGERLVEERG
jgi:hypothetical protein